MLTHRSLPSRVTSTTQRTAQRPRFNPVASSRRCHSAMSVVAFKQSEQSTNTSSKTTKLTAGNCFSAMCTMLGGLETNRLVGYAGQWRTWDVGTNPNSPPALIDDSVNIRLWRITDKDTMAVQQANLYQAPAKMAGPSTRFLPYLSGNTMSGRPDGYGLRVWEFKPDSDLVNPDASSWIGNPTAAERSMRVLSVPGVATTIINGALPSSFDEEHQPRFWVLEFIIKETGADDRRWASMNWYELGALVVNRSINEDLHSLPDDLDSRFIDPQQVEFQPRRDKVLGDIDDYVVTQGRVSQQGTATRFAYDYSSDNTLTTTTYSCTWSLGAAAPYHTIVSQAQQAGAQAVGAAAVAAAAVFGDVPGSAAAAAGTAEAVANAGHGGPSQLVTQSYPDMSYCRVPRSLRKVIASGQPSVMFEAGTVLRDGSVGRWLLEYNTSGDRLIKAATYEHYPANHPAGSKE